MNKCYNIFSNDKRIIWCVLVWCACPLSLIKINYATANEPGKVKYLRILIQMHILRSQLYINWLLLLLLPLINAIVRIFSVFFIVYCIEFNSVELYSAQFLCNDAIFEKTICVNCKVLHVSEFGGITTECYYFSKWVKFLSVLELIKIQFLLRIYVCFEFRPLDIIELIIEMCGSINNIFS